MSTACLELQEVLHREIPLSRHMGVRVDSCAPDHVVLAAPLEDNLNHKSTAFGGSLYSLGVLSGWCLLYMFVRARGLSAQIVIHESSIAYRHPVRHDFTARCTATDMDALQRAAQCFARRGVARIRLESSLYDGALAAAHFQGSYALVRPDA